MENKKLKLVQIPVLLFLCLLCGLLPQGVARAADVAAISFGTINYDTLEMQVYNNNNSIVYYSTDSDSWSEVEGTYNNATKSYNLDISWIPGNSDVTLYFKGDTVKTVKTITLPAQNTAITVDYDKVEGEFTFNEVEEAETFQWRKLTDYHWNTVDLDETASSYIAFLGAMETLRTIGTKVIIRIPQEVGTSASNVGARPSKEVTVVLAARATAPTLKVDPSHLTINTTTLMEYYDTATSLWLECTRTMAIEDMAPKALYENGGKAVTLKIRKAATDTTPCSKTAYVLIPGQPAAPAIGGATADITYYYMNGKLMLQFNNASATNIYEYVIIKSNGNDDLDSAAWKSVTASSLMTIANTTAPAGSTIYVRKKGQDAYAAKNINLVLASAVSSFSVTY